ncbi:hypothetical protein [Agaribacterium sp. ZY112]|uniref:hypothetical protein n=1 Tax=Agaribacterium sp. ZY112 TaxID=3233574 RepID=UPI0035232615
MNLINRLVLFCASLAVCQLSLAGSLEQAKRIHDRLAGTAPSEPVLLQMATLIDDGDADAAAALAMENEGFYSATLKNWASPWTNRDFDVFTPLNDYSATVIGLVRDEIDYREVLYGNHIYVSNASGLSAYNNSNNNHYAELEAADISLKDTLVHRDQHSVTGLPESATSGVITSRAAAKAFFIAGTNRAQFRYTLVNHLCMDLEQVHDVTRVPDRIRQDVSRSPGGDSRVFLNTCMGCHAGMDPLTQSMAYYDFVFDVDADPEAELGQIEYNTDIDPETNSRVQPKYFNNDATFPYGYVTPDDTWVNYWRVGQNAVLGWDQSLNGEGEGLRSMMQELAHSEAFASCAVRKVFKQVCLRDAHDDDDLNQLQQMQTSFVGNGHNLKSVFAQSALYCAGN